jgi:mutator protein MutT
VQEDANTNPCLIAPGGKLEEGETIDQCAIREVKEEVGLTVHSVEARGVLDFYFVDSPSSNLRCHVFQTTNFEGDLVESYEMRPEWINIADIPYDKMWHDDSIWLPQMLEGQKVYYRFYFDLSSGKCLKEERVYSEAEL